MKTAITAIVLLIQFHSSGQNVVKDDVNNNHLSELQTFFGKIENEESDTFITPKDSWVTYRIVFSIPGSFSDPKVQFSRTFHSKNVMKNKGYVEIMGLHHKADSLVNGFRGGNCQSIKTTFGTRVWGEPLKDYIWNVESVPSFWASCISAQAMRFSPPIVSAVRQYPELPNIPKMKIFDQSSAIKAGSIY